MSAPSTDSREADRNSLRTILADIQAGINERDLDRILRHLSDDAVVTYQNADVTRGKAEISAYFNKNFNGSNPIIKRFTIRGEVAAPAVFIGDTAVAYGTRTTRWSSRPAANLRSTENGALPFSTDRANGWSDVCIFPPTC
jgi:ketosteroid isomerase-like protein